MEEKVVKGSKFGAGKTKELYTAVSETGDMFDGMAVFHSTDAVTAGDGLKRTEIPGKGAWSNTTTCNVFRILKECGIPVAFQRQLSDTDFLAELLDMILIEVIVRRKSTGSNGQRYPYIPDLTVFPQLVVQLHLKTKNRRWLGVRSGQIYEFPPNPMTLSGDKPASYDDPLMEIDGGNVNLYNAHLPMDVQKPFLTLPLAEVFMFECVDERIKEIKDIAVHSFLILEGLWRQLNFDFLDCKFEFGFAPNGMIMLGDVLDADSWRPTFHGKHISKEAFRRGEPDDAVAAKFSLTAKLSHCFRIPEQRVVVWSGSRTDDVTQFVEALRRYAYHNNRLCAGLVGLETVCSSCHKEPVSSTMLAQMLEMNPVDTVIVTNVGRSNGAGPLLAANVTIPVFSTVPTYKTFTEDVHSSLHTPSEDPLATVVDAGNAMLAALQHLASRNAALRAVLRLRQEERFTNVLLLP